MEIRGINHITFSVSNIETSFNFYKDVLGFVPKLKWSKGAYFLSGDLWVCLSLDDKTRNKELVEYTHTAFDISKDSFKEVSNRIINSKVKIYKENKSEGNSIYFLDPDGHKLEIHFGTLESRLCEYKKQNNPDFIFF
ncbi:MAG: glutathione transferase [Bacteriovoracaceae bacterium]|nr:glutathione transferase [Bacteriovoracaceae bacterium]